MVTVRDCLKLQAFKGAKVLAGERGLDNIVSAVSVLEVSEIDSDMSSLAKGNEIVITAFYSIKDNIQQQCNTIRTLAKRGEVAIVIFYVGIFLPRIDKRVIEVAEDVGIPLICMPENRMDINYASVITSVMEKVLYGDTFSSRLISSTILNLLNFNTYDSFEEAIKDIVLKSNIQIVLLNDMYEAVFTVETKNDVTTYEVIKCGIENQIDKSTSCTKLKVKNTITYWGPVKLYNDKKYYLLIVDNDETYSQSEISKFTEIVEIAIKMWRFNPIEDIDFEVINALKEGDRKLLFKIRDRENLKINSIYTVAEIVGLKDKNKLLDIQTMALCNGYRMFVSNDNENVSIALIKDIEAKTTRKTQSGNNIVDKIKMLECDAIYIDDRKMDIDEAKRFFDLVNKFERLTKIIYENKSIYTIYELIFAKIISDIEEGDSKSSECYKIMLRVLDDSKNDEDKVLLETLSTFVLDCDFSIPKTAEVLFMHTNTIQYRIKKIKSLLKVSSLDSSNIPFLSIALALKRIEYSYNT